MKTTEFNLSNWSGKTASISYTDQGTFNFYDYTWSLGDFVEVHDGEGYRTLETNEGIEGNIYLATENLEMAVILAGQWIANHV